MWDLKEKIWGDDFKKLDLKCFMTNQFSFVVVVLGNFGNSVSGLG